MHAIIISSPINALMYVRVMFCCGLIGNLVFIVTSSQLLTTSQNKTNYMNVVADSGTFSTLAKTLTILAVTLCLQQRLSFIG